MRHTRLFLCSALAIAILPAAALRADDKPANGANGSEINHHVDKLLKDYQTFKKKGTQVEDTTRKEFEELSRELAELTQLKLQMVHALATQKAHALASSASDDEVSARDALSRELRAVVNQLRGEVQQARTQADQLASQLENARRQAIARLEAAANGKDKKATRDGDKAKEVKKAQVTVDVP